MRYRIACVLLVLAIFTGGAEAQSAGRAFWRSLLVPGWGQRYAGKDASASRFLAAELALWGGYFALHWLGETREDNFRSYAAEHARARTAGKGDSFLDDLGFYESSLQHDQFALYQDGPEAQLYADDPGFFWEWDREASRRRYRQLRNDSETARRQALYLSGLVVVNHLFAAVHAARSAGTGARQEPHATVWQVGCDPLSGGVRVACVRRF